MKRPARLQAASSWLKTFGGKNVVRGYAKWFGVDLGCALKELQKLGVELDPTYVERLLCTLRSRRRPRELGGTPEVPTGYGSGWDDDFTYIAGHTASGVAFGVTWREWEREDTYEAEEVRERPEDELPF